ncbi:helix-turn-helix domain-containing protein [Candidatus Peregrinibacteria bacterium]|nr:helix-turn-helix domain-containing protein [Candidatus Peregrinibacteria bacterium]
MPQMQLPFFPVGLTLINRQVGFEKKEGRVYYFHGHLPVFSHAEDDVDSFRFIISQLVLGGNVRQIEIVKAFGVAAISVKRSVKRLREQGIQGFYSKRKGRSAHVLVPEVIEKAQRLLSKGENPAAVAKKLHQNADTIRKAIKSGRLRKKKVVLTARKGKNPDTKRQERA